MNKCMTLVLVLAGCTRYELSVPENKGKTGTNGHNSLVSFVATAPSCLNGGVVFLSGLDLNDDMILDSVEVTNSQAICNGLNGSNGNDGSDGSDGTNGLNGHNALVGLVTQIDGGGASCTNGGVTVLAGTDLNDNGSLAVSEVISSVDVCNGNNGLAAPTQPYSITSIVDPCGPQSAWDEVFLKLANNTLVASFSENQSGLNTRFSVLKTNTGLRTTDGTMCYFSVDNDGNLYNEHN